MKDYSMNCNDREYFILGYNIDEKHDTIIVNFANGEKWVVPYNDINESKLIEKMEKQVKDSEKFYLKQEKKSRNASMFCCFSVIAVAFLFMIDIDWINPYLLYSLVSVFGLASLFSFVRASKSEGKLDDLDKNMNFLEIQEKLNNNIRKRNQNILVNTSKKTRDIVNNTSEDKPVFNINSFNYVPYSDIEQIMLNIERNERFGFDYEYDYEYSEVHEKSKTRKRTR